MAMITSEDLLREISSEFLLTYRRQVGRHVLLPNLMRLGMPSTLRTERYGYWESTPTLDRWDQNNDIPEDELLSRSYSVVNLDWAKLIGFHENDVDDVQLNGFKERARQLAGRARKLPQDVMFQMVTAGTNARLLKSIPNAPDGAALYATTAGGSARFGVTGGNVLTGGGVTGAQIRSDFWQAMERFRLFQDTEGEELLDDEIDQGVTIVYNASLEEQFHEAFLQDRTVAVVQNVAASENVAAAAPTNTAGERMRAGLTVNLWPTQKITDNDWTITLNSELVPRPMFQQVRMAPRTWEDNRANSMKARHTKRQGIAIDARFGFGINLPYGSILVNN